MDKVYLVCLVLGMGIPLIALVFDFFDSCVDFALELGDIDLGVGFDICFLPLSMHSICTASLVFGGLGIFLNDMPNFKRNLIAGICAYISAVLIQSLLKYLKTAPEYARKERDLTGKICTVCNKIMENGYGAISFREEGTAAITMTAKEEYGRSISQGENVEIIEVKEAVAIVRRCQ